MSGANTFTQCILKKPVTGWTQTSWIPSEFAVVGHFVDLKENDEWSQGWEVISAGYKMDAVEARRQGNDYKNMRKVTDV